MIPPAGERGALQGIVRKALNRDIRNEGEIQRSRDRFRRRILRGATNILSFSGSSRSEQTSSREPKTADITESSERISAQESQHISIEVDGAAVDVFVTRFEIDVTNIGNSGVTGERDIATGMYALVADSSRISPFQVAKIEESYYTRDGKITMKQKPDAVENHARRRPTEQELADQANAMDYLESQLVHAQEQREEVIPPNQEQYESLLRIVRDTLHRSPDSRTIKEIQRRRIALRNQIISQIEGILGLPDSTTDETSESIKPTQGARKATYRGVVVTSKPITIEVDGEDIEITAQRKVSEYIDERDEGNLGRRYVDMGIYATLPGQIDPSGLIIISDKLFTRDGKVTGRIWPNETRTRNQYGKVPKEAELETAVRAIQFLREQLEPQIPTPTAK